MNELEMLAFLILFGIECDVDPTEGLRAEGEKVGLPTEDAGHLDQKFLTTLLQTQERSN